MKSFSIFDFLSTLEFYYLLAFLFLLSYFARFLPPDLMQSGIDPASLAKSFWLLLPDYAVLLMSKLVPFSFVLSILLVVGIIVSANRLIKIREAIHKKFSPVKDAEKGELMDLKNEKWKKVIVHINSENQSDWKLAILECDIMLGEILERMGYMQPSIGEKLKAVEPSDFTNIESAWEAHKIRNSIAHEGSEFTISHREAKRVIGLYELVFREFNFI